jgi:dTDP-4-amino-4,6-dideoxygalactose transaminase
MDNPIYVSQPDLPNIDEYFEQLRKIWDSKILTNNGPYLSNLENELADFLNIKYISVFNNATTALMVAIKALNLNKQVITTPYSFVATASSLLWSNVTPIFVDIDPKTMNIDPSRIEDAINEETQAIMPVHCYGLASDLDRIEEIAQKYKLKVIYDAAHAFGIEINNKSILTSGDMSVVSFHATKVFNTIEGGAIVTGCKELHYKIQSLRNFGFRNETEVIELGINGKMSEFNACFGSAQLKRFSENIKIRKKIDAEYRESLKNITGLRFLNVPENQNYNYSYFPIFIDNKTFPLTRDQLYQHLKDKNIFARRYFYPLITDFEYYKNFNNNDFPVAKKVASEVLCLPMHANLTLNDTARVIKEIKYVCS